MTSQHFDYTEHCSHPLSSWCSPIDEQLPTEQSSCTHAGSRLSQIFTSLTNIAVEQNIASCSNYSDADGMYCADANYYSTDNTTYPPATIGSLMLTEDAPYKAMNIPRPRRCTTHSSTLPSSTHHYIHVNTGTAPEMELGTPSSVSSSSSYMAMTPMSHSMPPKVMLASGDACDMDVDTGAFISHNTDACIDKRDISMWQTNSTSMQPWCLGRTMLPTSNLRTSSSLDGALGETNVAWFDQDWDDDIPSPDYVHRYDPNFFQTSQTNILQPTQIYPHQDSIHTLSEFSAPENARLSSSVPSQTAFSPPHPPLPPRRDISSKLPIHQPQPIRPIPIIPLSNLSSAASSDFSTLTSNTGINDPAVAPVTHSKTQAELSRLSLLFQPVSNNVRYQLRTHPSSDTQNYSFPPLAPIDENFPDISAYYGNGTPKHYDGLWCHCGCMGA